MDRDRERLDFSLDRERIRPLDLTAARGGALSSSRSTSNTAPTSFEAFHRSAIVVNLVGNKGSFRAAPFVTPEGSSNPVALNVEGSSYGHNLFRTLAMR